MSTFSIERRNSGKKIPTSLQETKAGWCWSALIFCVDVHLKLTPVRMRPPEPDPFCVDVTNGWTPRIQLKHAVDQLCKCKPVFASLANGRLPWVHFLDVYTYFFVIINESWDLYHIIWSSAVATYEATALVKFVALRFKVGYFQMLISYCDWIITFK